MAQIKILSTQVANQIAAGEVVERPASIVKELVENSLDAGASRISLEIEEGGKQLIKITDNGSGIAKDQLSLALYPHATSKLVDISDLNSIVSYGFRGEALASISSVSKLTLISRTADDTNAWKIFNAGKEYRTDTTPVAHPLGTTIEVAQLFYNTPARLKFLKSSSVEFNYIEDVVQRIAIVNPQVEWTVHNNGKLKHKYPRISFTTDNAQQDNAQELLEAYKQRIIQVLPNSFDEDSITIQAKIETFALEFKLILNDHSLLSTKKTAVQFSYINGRIIKDKIIISAMKQVLQALYDQVNLNYIIFINIDPTCLDINVHPSKAEVRFIDAHKVHSFIFQNIFLQLAAQEKFSQSKINSILSSYGSQDSLVDFSQLELFKNTIAQANGKHLPFKAKRLNLNADINLVDENKELASSWTTNKDLENNYNFNNFHSSQFSKSSKNSQFPEYPKFRSSSSSWIPSSSASKSRASKHFSQLVKDGLEHLAELDKQDYYQSSSVFADFLSDNLDFQKVHLEYLEQQEQNKLIKSQLEADNLANISDQQQAYNLNSINDSQLDKIDLDSTWEVFTNSQDSTNLPEQENLELDLTNIANLEAKPLSSTNKRIVNNVDLAHGFGFVTQSQQDLDYQQQLQQKTAQDVDSWDLKTQLELDNALAQQLENVLGEASEQDAQIDLATDLLASELINPGVKFDAIEVFTNGLQVNSSQTNTSQAELSQDNLAVNFSAFADEYIGEFTKANHLPNNYLSESQANSKPVSFADLTARLQSQFNYLNLVNDYGEQKAQQLQVELDTNLNIWLNSSELKQQLAQLDKYQDFLSALNLPFNAVKLLKLQPLVYSYGLKLLSQYGLNVSVLDVFLTKLFGFNTQAHQAPKLKTFNYGWLFSNSQQDLSQEFVILANVKGYLTVQQGGNVYLLANKLFIARLTLLLANILADFEKLGNELIKRLGNELINSSIQQSESLNSKQAFNLQELPIGLQALYNNLNFIHLYLLSNPSKFANEVNFNYLLAVLKELGLFTNAKVLMPYLKQALYQLV